MANYNNNFDNSYEENELRDYFGDTISFNAYRETEEAIEMDARREQWFDESDGNRWGLIAHNPDRIDFADKFNGYNHPSNVYSDDGEEEYDYSGEQDDIYDRSYDYSREVSQYAFF